jgi:hypothetical protein
MSVTHYNPKTVTFCLAFQLALNAGYGRIAIVIGMVNAWRVWHSSITKEPKIHINSICGPACKFPLSQLFILR